VNPTILKIIVTPAIIGLASLAGRKWGHAVSGWIVALPLTTGPIVFFLAMSHGPAFAAETAAAILTGCFSVVAFAMVYARLALRWRWLPTLAASSLAFFVMTALLRKPSFPVASVWIGVLAAVLLALRSLPRLPTGPSAAHQLPGRWEIPLRMLIATVFVLGITALAAAAGPQLAGLLAPFPVFTALLAAFAQHRDGGAAAISVLRGLLMGLFSFATFMFALATLLQPAGILPAFAIALLLITILQALTFRLLRSGSR
jgi:hypothetical protein